MTHHTHSCTLAAILFLLVGSLSGCGDDNEKSAKISGVVGENISPAEAKKRMQSSAKDMPKNYPSGGATPSSNRRR